MMDGPPSEDYAHVKSCTYSEKVLAALKECSEELALMIEHEYRDTLMYPIMKGKYERDMEPVYNARKLLGGKP